MVNIEGGTQVAVVDALPGEAKYAACGACHGAQGGGGVGPALAGQSVEYIVGRLNQYKAGEKVGNQSNLMWVKQQDCLIKTLMILRSTLILYERYFSAFNDKVFRFFADTFFAKRYGHRAVVLETVAGVPGMVAGMLVHLKSLRTHKRGYGPIIRKLLAEAENERMHLMFFIEIAEPNKLERSHNLAQFIFWHFYLVMYLISPRTAHMMTHYFEEEAVKSYTEYLELIESGRLKMLMLLSWQSNTMVWMQMQGSLPWYNTFVLMNKITAK